MKFICPYCHKTNSTDNAIIVEEEQIVNSQVVEETYDNITFLQSKKRFCVYQCKSCARYLALTKSVFITILIVGIVLGGLGLIFMDSAILFLIGLGLCVLAFCIYFIGGQITKIYPHTTYEEAKRCGALYNKD